MTSDTRDVRGRALALYRRYVGEPDEPRDVYLGFGLFFGGIAAAVVGLGLFLASTVPPETSMLVWRLREAAFVASAVGLPAFLASVVVLLPAGRLATGAAAAGSVVCLVGVAVFVANYPYNWNVPGPDASAQGILVYAVGIAALAATSGTALVTNYIERAGAGGAVGGAAGGAGAEGGADAAGSATGGDATGASAGVDDADVQRQAEQDVRDAIDGADLTWGGVDRERTETKRITFTEDESLGEVDTSSFEETEAAESRGGGTDDQVAELQKLRGGTMKETKSESTTDEQAEALSALRERQQREEEERAAQAGTIDKLRDRLGL